MHELPVTQAMLEIALRHAARAGATQVTDLYIVVGQLSSIVDDSVQFYWNIISKDTIAEGARLHFKRISMKMICFDCGQYYEPELGKLACTHCGSTLVEVAGGDEFRLDSISIEKSVNVHEQAVSDNHKPANKQ
ncbi:MAG: hydrogenase maturation nickel metallochaperone HypA [Chloroflexota bacterium]